MNQIPLLPAAIGVVPVALDSPELLQLVSYDQGEVVTTSLVIAEGVGNEHRAVLQVIRTYLADFERFGRVAFEMQPFVTAGGTQNREVAKLNEGQAMLLLTYFRNTEVVREFKIRLVAAFLQLRNGPRAPVAELSRIDILRLAMDSEQKRLAAEAKVAEQALKVAALDRLSEAEGSFSLREAAKAVDIPERKFIQALHSMGWTYRHRGGDWLAKAEKTRQGLLTHKVSTIEKRDGTEKIVERVRVTPKGLTRLAQLLHAEAA